MNTILDRRDARKKHPAGKKIKKPFWMPFNVEAYSADTADLSPLEHGVLLLLRLHYWRAGPPKDSDEILARIARLSVREWQKVRPTVERFFEIDGVWINEEWDSELATAYTYINKASEAGKKAANARWERERRRKGNAHNSDTDRMRSASGSECDGNANYNIGGKPPMSPAPAREVDDFLSAEEEAALAQLEAEFVEAADHE